MKLHPCQFIVVVWKDIHAVACPPIWEHLCIGSAPYCANVQMTVTLYLSGSIYPIHRLHHIAPFSSKWGSRFWGSVSNVLKGLQRFSGKGLLSGYQRSSHRPSQRQISLSEALSYVTQYSWCPLKFIHVSNFFFLGGVGDIRLASNPPHLKWGFGVSRQHPSDHSFDSSPYNQIWNMAGWREGSQATSESPDS